MFLVRRRRIDNHWANYGCLTINIATMTGMSDAQQNAYLAVIKQAYPPTPGDVHWVRNTRYGISATTGTPDWNTDFTRYWPNMYARSAASDIMTGRKMMFEPILWVRQAAGNPIMCNPNPAPNYFGRNSSGAIVVAEGSDTWRRDIRLNLDRLCWSDVGTTGGEPYVTNAKRSNFSVLLLIGPNEIDYWVNTRWYYLTDAEAGGSAPDAPSRASTALAGTAGLNTLLLRIYDHQRHMFNWGREKRPDVGMVYPSIIHVAADHPSSREFNIYDMLKFTHAGAGLTAQGFINDVCDAHQIHPHMYQNRIPNPWTGSVPADGHISCYHYWKANQEVQTWRLQNSLPDNTRPLLSTETGQDYFGSGAVTAGRTDLFQLRRLKYGMLVLGQLYYGCSLINFYAVGRSAATGFNTIDPANDTTYWGGPAPNRDADFAFASLDMRETSDDIVFTAKPWQDYWKGWQVWFEQQQDPIDGGPSVCPFVEWNRVIMSGSTVTMNAGGRNVVARKKNVRRGLHTFRAEVRLTAAGSAAALRVSGHDRLNGLNLVSSTILSGVQDWTPLSVSFTPRQHGNPRVPDPAYAVLIIDHNGTGTCEVRSPTISVGGASPVEQYFDIQVMDVSWTPANPVANQAVVFSVLLKNVGNQPSPSGTIHGCRFDIDGAFASWSDNITTALAPGSERWQSANGGPSGVATWNAVAGQHTLLATFDDANRMPAEKFKTNNTMTKIVTVSIATGPTAPPQAVAAGLTTLFFNEDFDTLSFYHPTTNPGGRWRFNDFNQNANHAGHVDLDGQRTFMINQTMDGSGSDTYSNQAAYNAIQPYLPASQLDSTTIRLTARRARLEERPALRTVINAIAVNIQNQTADTVTWLGSFLTTEKIHPFAPADISRSAYVECRVRFTPSATSGIFSSIKIFDTSEVGGSPEIAIFESDDLTPMLWKTNINHTSTGPSFTLEHNSLWNDGAFHTIGLLWTDTALQVYRDNVLSQSLTGTDAAFFNMPLRLILTHTADPYWADSMGRIVPTNVEQVYMDLDYVRVWTEGAEPPPVEELQTGNPDEDLYDALIVQYATQYGHPSPRILKAMIKWESNQIFDVYYTSSNTPCGIFPGWTSAESRAFGLMQISPACGDSGGGRMLLTNGHPNLTTDPGDPLWSGSVYNPSLNIDVGIESVAAAYNFFKGQFPTCPDSSLVLMAAAGYVGSWDTVISCGSWTDPIQIDYVENVVRIYEEWYGPYTQSTGYDLVVDSVSWSPTNPTPGQAVTFSAVIHNIGSSATPAGIIHGIGFVVDGSTVTWSDNNTSSLAGGATRSQTANGGVSGATWSATAGTHTISAVVDDANRFPSETDKTNNTKTASLTVTDLGNVIRVNLGGSLQSAINQATAGTIILVQPGIYNISGSAYNGISILNKSGTALSPITIRGDGGRAVFDFTNMSAADKTGLNISNCSYWRFENLAFRNCKQVGSSWVIGINISNCVSCVFDNIETYGHGGMGLYMTGNSRNNTIQYSDSRDNADPGNAGLYADGIVLGDMPNTATGNRVMYCRLYRNSADGIHLWETEAPVYIEGTWCYQNGWGFRLGVNQEYPPHSVIGSRAFNNVGNGFDSSGGGGNMIIRDNASYGNGGQAYAFYAPATPIMTNNITYDPGPPSINPGIY